MAQLTDDCFAFSGPLLPLAEMERLIAERVTPVAEVEEVALGPNGLLAGMRDIERVCGYFARYGIMADAHELARDMWNQKVGALY